MQIAMSAPPERDISAADTFADITSVPYLGYRPPTEDNPLAYIEFDGDLAGPELRQVMFRYSTTADAETIYRNMRQAMGTLQTYIDLGSPTAAQTTAQVKFQARLLRHLLRWQLQDFSGTT